MGRFFPLKRDCEAVQVPDGTKKVLPAGMGVFITQCLGGTFTVLTEPGHLFSIAGKDADAVGRDAEGSSDLGGAVSGEEPVEKLVWAQLRKCYDPEIPHNIVDLGLIYECKVSEPAAGEYRVDVKMSLTAPGCGMGDWLKQDAQSKILMISKVKEADVQVVFEPPWNPSMMNEALRRDLNLM